MHAPDEFAMTPDEFETYYPGCLPFHMDGPYWYCRILMPPHLVILGGALSVDHLKDMADDFFARIRAVDPSWKYPGGTRGTGG